MTQEYRSFYYDEMQKEPVTDDFTLPEGPEMTPDLLRRLIDEHKESRVPRYMRLKAAYEGKYLIFDKRRNGKPDYKPDNRLAAPIAQYLCDTFTGYFIGVPATVRHAREDQHEWLSGYELRNEQEDKNAELAEESSKYGHCFEYLFHNEDGEPESTVLTPIATFMVKDDTVRALPMFGVRYSHDENGVLQGSFCDAWGVTAFGGEGGIEFSDPEPHAFGDVPMVEYVENKEKRGVFEGVLNLIEAYNKVLSEKANDVDYFADAYLVVEGVELPEDFKKDLREYRLINPYDKGGSSPAKVYFLQKPDSDGTQENLISRLETLIFKTAMVPDISDESFGTASGIALKMRLLPMSNLAKKKERKFKSAMRRRYRLLASYPNKPFDDWQGVEITMHRNMPEDTASEAATAGALSGIVSEETMLAQLSCVDDPRREMERKAKERREGADEITGGFPTNRTPRGQEKER